MPRWRTARRAHLLELAELFDGVAGRRRHLRRRHDLAPVVHIRRLYHAGVLGYAGVGDQRRDTGVRLPRPSRCSDPVRLRRGRRDARITQTIRHIIKSSRPARPRPRRRSCRCTPRRGTRGPRRSRLPVGSLSTCSRTDVASVRDERCGTRPRRPVIRHALRRAIVDLTREYALLPG